MSDQLQMFGPMISEDTSNAISLPELQSGVTPCGSPDGQTTGKSGPDLAPASHSARPAKAKRSTTKGIFGQSSFGSSKHEDLSFALANRFRQLTASLGSTLFKLTWTTRITPSGFSIPALRASEPRNKGTVCIGWPSPAATDGRRGGEQTEAMTGSSLVQWAAMAAWPTPQSSAESSGMRHARGVADTMTAVASLAGWPTAKPRDYRSENEASLNRPGHPPDLNKLVLLADGEQGSETMMRGNLTLLGQARLTAFGDQPIGFLLGPNGWEIVPASGQLNPAHSRWLMGLPPVWDGCGVTAMESLRKSRKRSSAHT